MTAAFARVPRAVYKSEISRDGRVLALIDKCLPATRSLTNDAEAVIEECAFTGALVPGRRVIYRDTLGRWDELLVDSELRFVDFRPLDQQTVVPQLLAGFVASAA
jgi:hypothetical protein